MEAQKVTDGSQKVKITIFIVFFIVAIFGYVNLISVLEGKSSVLGGFSSFDVATSTSSSFICGAATSVGLGAYSGRAFLKVWNDSTSTVYLSLSLNTTSTPAVTRTGIRLSPVFTTTTIADSSWDMNETGINWPHVFTCIANNTGSVVTYIQGR